MTRCIQKHIVSHFRADSETKNSAFEILLDRAIVLNSIQFTLISNSIQWMHVQIPFFDENNPNKKRELEVIRLAEHNFYDDDDFPMHKLHRLSVPVVTDRYFFIVQ